MISCEYVCVLLHASNEYRNIHSTSKVGTFLGFEHILAGSHEFKGLFEG